MRNQPGLGFMRSTPTARFFCNRDGIKVYSLDKVKLERRTGYSWYGGYATSLLAGDYPKWKKRLNR